MTSSAIGPVKRLLEERVPVRTVMEQSLEVAARDWPKVDTPPDWEALRALDFEGEFVGLTEWVCDALTLLPFPPEVNGLFFGFIWPPAGDRESVVAVFLAGSRTYGTSHDWAREGDVPADEFIYHPPLLLAMYRLVAFADGRGEQRERAIGLCHQFVSLAVAEWSRTAVRHLLRGEAESRMLFVGFDPWMGYCIDTLTPGRVGSSGSVLVSWSGAITDPARRALWHDQLRQVANWHERRWQEADVQPGFAALAALRGASAMPARPVFRWFDEELTGRIFVDADLAGGADALRREAARRGLALEEVTVGGRSHPLLVLDRLDVRGVDFRAFDLRGLYPDEDRLSFILLESEDAPFLDGRIAAIDNRAFNERAFMKPVAYADWYARAPSVHLREFGEEWTAELLAWLRWAFAPQFQYGHRDDILFRAPRLAWQCECLEDSIGRTAAMLHGLHRLRLHFQIEATRVQRLFSD